MILKRYRSYRFRLSFSICHFIVLVAYSFLFAHALNEGNAKYIWLIPAAYDFPSSLLSYFMPVPLYVLLGTIQYFWMGTFLDWRYGNHPEKAKQYVKKKESSRKRATDEVAKISTIPQKDKRTTKGHTVQAGLSVRKKKAKKKFAPQLEKAKAILEFLKNRKKQDSGPPSSNPSFLFSVITAFGITASLFALLIHKMGGFDKIGVFLFFGFPFVIIFFGVVYAFIANIEY